LQRCIHSSGGRHFAGWADPGPGHHQSTGRRPRAKAIGTPRSGHPTGEWDLIRREQLTFIDPHSELPPIDRLEGCAPATTASTSE